MTSILNNAGAISALQTLRSIGSSIATTQGQVSSGSRIQTASDNAAYWSISTTMRSDSMAISAVADALSFAAAKADTAYAALDAVIDVLGEFKSRLVMAREGGVDKGKIQKELEQLKREVQSMAHSASFSGENWLNTDIANIYDFDLNKASSASAFVRAASGGVAVRAMDFHLSAVSLFNSTGGGLLQADARDLETLGGMRRFSSDEPLISDSTVYDGSHGSGWMLPEGSAGGPGIFYLDDFPVGSPLDFTVPGAQISFDIILDKEASNPNNYSGTAAELEELPGPYYLGYPKPITITKADVDAFDPSLGGVITTNTEFAAVLNSVLNVEGAYVSANYGHYVPPGSGSWIHNPKMMSIQTLQAHGDGSYVEIANLSSVGVSAGGLKESFDFGSRGSGMELYFEDFIVHEDGENLDGVEINFTFSVNGGPATSHSFNRTYVNELLGKDSGKVETAEEMAILLHSLIDADWPDLIIEATSPSTIMMKSDPATDRKWGSGTRIEFDSIRVNIEPIPTINFLAIDIATNPDKLSTYIDYIEIATERIIEGAATLGAFQNRIDMQSAFTSKLMFSLDKSIGRLVDADMNEASTRLKALQTQEQLGIQSLQIANSNSENVVLLFR
ncbi:flagellin [Pararhizobium sp. LjRoot255]|uniref:flagellin N-terminal helical domain-containing protein n=1 Tax=Pararhizobium sp. LjRoot255 TaxID=3342298 RepID=UPI003ECE3BE2